MTATLDRTRADAGANALVSADTVAEWLGVHARQVRKLAETGIIQRDGKGRYHLQTTVRAVAVHLREQAAGRGGAGGGAGPDLVGERALLARSQREAQEMRNAALRGEMLTEAAVEEVIGLVIGNARAAFLALPTRVTPLLLGKSSPAAVHTILTNAVFDVLTRLSEADVILDDCRTASARQ